MHYAQIKNFDIASGAGIRVSLFVSGCRNRCRGCFQPQTWDFSFGREFTEQTEEEILELLEPGFIAGLTLLGGDPFEPENQEGLLPLLEKVRESFPAKDIWAYTGYIYEELLCGSSPAHSPLTGRMLGMIDVLVDGPFVEELKDMGLRFRGSSNQRLLDLAAMRRGGAGPEKLIILPDRERQPVTP